MYKYFPYLNQSTCAIFSLSVFYACGEAELKPFRSILQFQTIINGTPGTGCHFGSLFVGALAYADELIYWHPCSANAMRHMLRLCDDYAAQFNVVFNASKSKCLCLNFCNAEMVLCISSSHFNMTDISVMINSLYTC